MTSSPRLSISNMRQATGSFTLALIVMLGLGPVVATPAQAQTLTVLYNFTGGSSDGEYPFGGLIEDKAGHLYGTTTQGGASNQGIVFEVTGLFAEKVLHSFSGADGAFPVAGLTLDAAGNLYGTTFSGGASTNGTVFEITKAGKETVLHSFAGGPKDGCNPAAAVLRDKAGNLYGTTVACGSYGYGTVFKITSSGKESVLYNFTGGTDGANPFAGLIQDAVGNLYGTTYQGGAFCESGCGTVFKIGRTGKETVLHTFAGGTADGCYSYGTPAMDKAGTLYGTTEYCGSSGGGTVWKVTKSGSESLLHSLEYRQGDNPFAGVILDAHGNVYGSAYWGGQSVYGTVYEVTGNGAQTNLHSFAFVDGAEPNGGVIMDAKGNLYGTTVYGGEVYYGVVWKLAPKAR